MWKNAIASLTAPSDEPAEEQRFALYTVAAGSLSPAQDDDAEQVTLQELLIHNPLNTFIFRVQGDSMQDAGIPHNSYVVVDRALHPLSGLIVVAQVNGDFTVKRLIEEAGQWELRPENPMHDPIPVLPDMEVNVWGVVTKVIIDLQGK